jgi:hypothetical protein
VLLLSSIASVWNQVKDNLAEPLLKVSRVSLRRLRNKMKKKKKNKEKRIN